jgi:hypothetical protein
VTGDLDTEDCRPGRSGGDSRRSDRDNGGVNDRPREEGFSAGLSSLSPAQPESRGR